MRPFFSTPLFRLLTVVIVCALLFPIAGFGLTANADPVTDAGNFSLIAPGLFARQLENWKKLGISVENSWQLPSVQAGGEKTKKPDQPATEQNGETKPENAGGAGDRSSLNSGERQAKLPPSERLSPNEFSAVKNQRKTPTPDGISEGLKSSNNSTSPAADASDLPIQTNKPNDAAKKAQTETAQKSRRPSYSEVKNLPDAEKLRQTTASIPQIPAPIPSTGCLAATLDCPSGKNREVPSNTAAARNDFGQSATSGENLFSSLHGPAAVDRHSKYSFENIIAFNNVSGKTLLPSSPFASSEIVSPTAESLMISDAAPSSAFLANFKNLEIYNPSAPAEYSASTAALLLPSGGSGVIFDFDGDGKADPSVWRPNTGEWYVLRSSDGATSIQPNFGNGSLGDRIVPGNYDGDLKTDYAYWRPSTGLWTIKQSSNNQIVNYTLGQNGDIPVEGDYDGDGKTDCAVFRPSNGTWYYRKSSNGTVQSQSWGLGTDVPVIGDFDGDGKTDFTVVRASDHNWYFLQSSNGGAAFAYGMQGDRLIPGDYDGDGKTDVAVWRAHPDSSDPTPNIAKFIILKSSNNQVIYTPWGLATDIPVPADYDGDGKTDVALYRPSNGTWYIIKSLDGSYFFPSLGTNGDIPVPSSSVGYFTSSNQSPTANAGGPYFAAVGSPIQFNGSGSSDSDGQIYSYYWEFGDGSAGTGIKPSYTYSSTGNFTVRLRVTDNLGAVSTQVSAFVQVIDGATVARLDPFNSVGGDDLVSRNFNWSTGLMGLPGRAGMNAGLSLSYNSLVWLKQRNGNNDYMLYDPDSGFPGPGFRMGMPVIENQVYNAQTGKNYYLMLTESGDRVEFRQVGSSNIYETADSSYTQLQISGNNLLVRTTDGTQYTYQTVGSLYQCTGIKDRNGNYITATYNNFGRLAQMTDTLGRIIVINYDTNGNPLSVAQSYNGQQRVYATFGYDTVTINTNFSDAIVAGPSNNSQITVLKQVAFDDGTYYRFVYNSYGQVYEIDNYAADNHKLSHVKYNLQSPGAQTDCPRYTQIENYAENWMTTTTNVTAPQAASWTMPDTNQAMSGLISQATAPDGTQTRIYYKDAGWDKGIPVLKEDWANNDRKRWATTYLTQSNSALSYPDNPRRISSATGDSNNVKKSGITYSAFMLPSGTVMYLPSDSFDYQADGTTIYRHIQTDYNFNTEYVSRYILGLLNETRFYEGSGTGMLTARSSVAYDEIATVTLSNIIQHDNTNYGVSLIFRGNKTSQTQWNVNSGESMESITNHVGYNIAGNPVYTQDPVQDTNHRVQIDYTDSFVDNINRNTYAYPTKVTDPDGYTVTTNIHFLTGMIDSTQGPRAGQTSDGVRGSIEKTYYDSIDRTIKSETLQPNGTATGAYIRYEYPSAANPNIVKIYTKLDASLSETLSFKVFDGVGQTIASASELPDSTDSTGGWSGQIFQYDNMGRLWKSSLPAETSASGSSNGWATTGDDAAWLYQSQTFDWKGRTLVSTNTDGTTNEAIYEGCGCAGGNAIVSRDEVGRRKKVIFDIFGRQYKSQILQIQPKSATLNDSGDPYSTSINTYNSLDQVTNVRIYADAGTSDGSCPIGICQESTTAYDGFERVWKMHAPEQRDNNDSLTYTTITYNPDGTTHAIIDGRGQITTLSYTNRKQLYQKIYTESEGITGVSPITYQYDTLGNRTRMDDQFGYATYDYNDLGQMSSESRYYSAINQSLTRNYAYNDAGMLKEITAPTNSSLNIYYTFDKIGRMKTLNGNGYGDLTASQPVVSSLKYRAFGSVKQTTYGNGLKAEISFNSRLQASSYGLKDSSDQILMGKIYQYTTGSNTADNDGLIKSTSNIDDANPDASKLNRRYTYDVDGRMDSAKAGNIITTTGPASGYTDGPFEQTYAYDVFNNMVDNTSRVWTSNPFCTNCPSLLHNYAGSVNNRSVVAGWQYDNDGRLISSVDTGGTTNASYDVAGQRRMIDKPGSTTNTRKQSWTDFDGDGNQLRLLENSAVTNYYFNSFLLGVTLADLTPSGAIERSYIYSSNGSRIAKQENNKVIWIHEEPAMESSRETKMLGSAPPPQDPPGGCSNNLIPSNPPEPCPQLTSQSSLINARVESDPLGRMTSDSSTYNHNGPSSYNNSGGGVGFYNPQEAQAFGVESVFRMRSFFWAQSMEFWSLSQISQQTGWQEKIETRSLGRPELSQGLGSGRGSGRFEYQYHSISWNPVSSEGVGVTAIYGNSFINLAGLMTTTAFHINSMSFESSSGNKAQTTPCPEAVLAAVPKSMQEGARTAIPLLLENAKNQKLTANQLAYLFASVQHESSFSPIHEGWGPTKVQRRYEPPSSKATELGNTNKGDGKLFRGRGYIQITGRGNYAKYSGALSLDLTGDPELVLKPEIAAFIAVDGMKNGVFSGKKIDKYIPENGKPNFVRARYVVNGRDKAGLIAGYVPKYANALKECGWQ